jgi:cytochrome c oxidase accessory protein FixG
MSLLKAPERVLPTLNDDGTRRWIRPRLFRGRFLRARRAVAWTLLVLFAALPFARMNGEPAMLLDVRHRQFFLLGRTFLPTDGVLLMLLLLAIFVGIFLATAVLGRVWCGWACPQTVYMEFVFRPIERLIEGDHRVQTRLDREGADARRFIKIGVYALLSAAVGNLFLSYFVGVRTLLGWLHQSPAAHPSAFAVMGITSAMVFADFAYFREQMCTVVCPYARFQSALLDRRSLVVAYDAGRGEPRGKKGKTTGDCVDCRLCVAACPTGIDIRSGLQLECIGCTQCMDACDGVMTKLRRPRGLIGYTSEEALSEKGARARSLRAILRPRVVVYSTLLIGLVVALVATAGTRRLADVSVLRGIGAPFVEDGATVRNHLRVKVQNRTNGERNYRITAQGLGDGQIVVPENPLRVAPLGRAVEGVFVVAPSTSFKNGVRTIQIHVTDGAGFETTVPYRLLGPEGGEGR